MTTRSKGSLTARPINFDYEASQSRYGLTTVILPAHNADIDTTTDPEDIWDAGGLYVPPTEARVHNIVSSSTSDDTGGTGAITVDIIGLDGSSLTIDETVTLDGTTPVATSNSFTFIREMTVATVGSGGSNVGVITATAVTDATVSAQINAAINRTRAALYVCPVNKDAYVTTIDLSIISGTAASTADFERLIQGTFNTAASPFVRETPIRLTVGDMLQTEFHPYLKLVSGEFMKLQIRAVSANDTEVAARIVIVEDLKP